MCSHLGKPEVTNPVQLVLPGMGEGSYRKDRVLLRGGPRHLSHKTIATSELTHKISSPEKRNNQGQCSGSTWVIQTA